MYSNGQYIKTLILHSLILRNASKDMYIHKKECNVQINIEPRIIQHILIQQSLNTF